MRYLIDGYNLMYDNGLLEKRLGSSGFRRVRTRFLNDLAESLGPLDAFQTTVVFDAAQAPRNIQSESSHKWITVVYAVNEESADDRIEQLIAADPSPKTLSVVSSDRRIRQAATRRGSMAVLADAFWVELSARVERRTRAGKAPLPCPSEPERDRQLSPEESAFWEHEFGELNGHSGLLQDLNGDRPLLTDAEIAEIEREVERERE
ncbi:MAG: hypothetical protein NVSMB9_22340 [Isosphaeraceae bacterium]